MQDPAGSSLSVLNLMEVVLGNADASSLGSGTSDYFHALCQQSFPGPLVGGSVGGKELNKWIDERITSCELPNMDYRKGEALRLLLSLLKIACQHYGKLRSAFGADTVLRVNYIFFFFEIVFDLIRKFKIFCVSTCSRTIMITVIKSYCTCAS